MIDFHISSNRYTCTIEQLFGELLGIEDGSHEYVFIHVRFNGQQKKYRLIKKMMMALISDFMFANEGLLKCLPTLKSFWEGMHSFI